MRRFSTLTENTLRQAGWYPDRNVLEQVASWKTNEILGEFDMFHTAERVLLEFGGLIIDQHGPGETCAREPFEIDPTLAAYEGDRFNELSTVVNTRLYPLGEVANGTSFWAIGDNEHVYILMNEIQLLGKNIDEALESLIIGRESTGI